MSSPKRPVHLVLVSCSGPKLKNPAPARDLYTSALFTKSRAWAEKNGSEWLILSALHGVVSPDTVVAPYDRTLTKMSKEERQAWTDKVLGQLERFRGSKVSVLAGKHYRGWIPAFGPVGLPLNGLQLGERLAWLTKAASA